jgi:hypothetical protein
LAHKIFDINAGTPRYRKLLNFASMNKQPTYACCDTLYFSEASETQYLDKTGSADFRISVYDLPWSGNFDC